MTQPVNSLVTCVGQTQLVIQMRVARLTSKASTCGKLKNVNFRSKTITWRDADINAWLLKRSCSVVLGREKIMSRQLLLVIRISLDKMHRG
jgi:hypothetical protein